MVGASCVVRLFFVFCWKKKKKGCQTLIAQTHMYLPVPRCYRIIWITCTRHCVIYSVDAFCLVCRVCFTVEIRLSETLVVPTRTTLLPRDAYTGMYDTNVADAFRFVLLSRLFSGGRFRPRAGDGVSTVAREELREDFPVLAGRVQEVSAASLHLL